MTNLAEYKNILTDLIALNRDRVDYLAIRLETSQGTSIMLRGDKVDTLSEGISTGGQVRACYKGGWGFAAFNQLSTLPQRIEEAIASAKLVGEDETILAAIAPIQTSCHLPLTGRDPRQVPLAEKKALCDHYNAILRGLNHQITTTVVRYGDSNQSVILATSDGTLIEQSWADLEMRFSATARDGDTVQTGRETTGSRQGYDD